MIGNDIGVEGAKAVSEMLRVNTTLKELRIWSKEKIWKMKIKQRRVTNSQEIRLELKEQKHSVKG